MIGSIASFATPALAGFAARGLTAMRMADERPWDVKQEGGQMDSGWGTGERRVCWLAKLTEHARVGILLT